MLVGQFHRDYQFFHLFVVRLSGVIDTLRKLWTYSFHRASTSSICEIMLPLVSLQVVGKIVCWGLSFFISWKNFLASFLLRLCSICSILLFNHAFFFRLIRTFASILNFLYVSWLALVFCWSHLELASFFFFYMLSALFNPTIHFLEFCSLFA